MTDKMAFGTLIDLLVFLEAVEADRTFTPFDSPSLDGKGVFSCQAVSGPDDGKVELLRKVAERFGISN